MTLRQRAAQAARQLQHVLAHVTRWFDNERVAATELSDRIDWTRIVPFVAMHVACLAAFWTGVSPVAVTVAVIAYLVRMFAITGFYHRYFSHRSFKTSRT